MEIEENNLLINYNLVEVMSNNIMVKTIQEEPNYLDFKVVLEEYKNIQFKNIKELG